MKGNKKILVLSVLVLLLTVVFSTYAIYRSSNTAGGEVTAAAWSVKIGQDNLESVTKLFDAEDLVCTSTASKVAGKIAPDSVCTITIPVNATGSEVDVKVTAELDTTNLTLPTGMTVALASGSDSQTIQYNASSMTADVVLNVTWTGATTDTTAKDGTDKTAAGKTIQIPVTLTARQALADGS